MDSTHIIYCADDCAVVSHLYILRGGPFRYRLGEWSSVCGLWPYSNNLDLRVSFAEEESDDSFDCFSAGSC